MEEILLILELIILPFFLSSTSSFRKGIFLGLFIALVFLCRIKSILLLIPLGVSLTLSILKKSPEKSKTHSVSTYGFLPLLLVFLASMSMVLAPTPFTNQLSLAKPEGLVNVALLIGPIYFGAKTDDKGVLYPSISLCIFSEIAMLFIFSGKTFTPIYILGKGIFALCQGGFFLLFPRIVFLLVGSNHFRKVYLPLGVWVFFFMMISRKLALNHLTDLTVIYRFLLTLILLGCIGALFIFLAYKKRLFLIIDNRR